MKTLLVGLHNPLSARPEDALWPAPPNSTGDRIVRMMQLIDPNVTDEYYFAAFDRVNLWRSRKLPEGRGAAAAYQEEGKRIRRLLVGRQNAILFGIRVWYSVTLTDPPQPFTHVLVGDTRCWFFPHPSGRNPFYNQERYRRYAGATLCILAGAREVKVA